MMAMFRQAFTSRFNTVECSFEGASLMVLVVSSRVSRVMIVVRVDKSTFVSDYCIYIFDVLDGMDRGVSGKRWIRPIDGSPELVNIKDDKSLFAT